MNLPYKSGEGAVISRRVIPGLAVLYFFLMLPNLNNSHPLQGDESYYTVSAVRMVETGNYMVPSYFGEERYNKPVLNYWLVAAAYKLMGVSMWSGRVPILLLACLVLIVTYRFGLLVLADRRKALLAAAMLAASPMFFIYSRVAMTEMALLCFSTLASFQYARLFLEKEGAGRHALLGSLFSGLAFMTKGPVALVPLGAAALYSFLAGRERRRALLTAIFHPSCLLMFAIITVPWYAYVSTLHPQAFAADMGTESGSIGNPFSPLRLGGHLAYYSFKLLLYFAPFLPAGLMLAYSRRGFPARPGFPYLWTVIIMNLAVFIIFVGMMRSRYLFPIFPLAGIILAETLFDGRWRSWLKAAGILLLIQGGFYAVYPLISGSAIRELTYEWKNSLSSGGSLGTELADPKNSGWVILYAGNYRMAPAKTADFLIIDGSDAPKYRGWPVIASRRQNHSVKYQGGRFIVNSSMFHLIERPNRRGPGKAGRGVNGRLNPLPPGQAGAQ